MAVSCCCLFGAGRLRFWYFAAEGDENLEDLRVAAGVEGRHVDVVTHVEVHRLGSR